MLIHQGLLEGYGNQLPAMQPLPSKAFEYAEFRRVRIGMDGCVLVDDRSYRVPQSLVRKEVELRLTAGVIEALYFGRRVASAPPVVSR